jgi:hypothetical protein
MSLMRLQKEFVKLYKWIMGKLRLLGFPIIFAWAGVVWYILRKYSYIQTGVFIEDVQAFASGSNR